MNKRTISAAILCLSIMLLFSTCTPAITPSDGSATGFVTISFAKGAGVKTLVPTVDMVVSTFDVTFTRTGATTVLLQDLLGTTTVTSPVELLTGNWTVDVNAYNAANDIIGTSSSDIDVLAGKTVTTDITVSILQGNGSLSLSSTWAGIDLLLPSIDGTLTPVTGTPIPVALVAGTSSATYSTTSIPAGSYTLDLLLTDGTATISHVVDTVQILKDATTSGSINFAKDPNYWGKITATVIVDLPSAVTFAFNPVSGTPISAGVGTTITVTPSRAVDGYSWYLNGVLDPSQTGATYQTGTALPVWSHLLTVIGRSGSTLSSASMTLEIIP